MGKAAVRGFETYHAQILGGRETQEDRIYSGLTDIRNSTMAKQRLREYFQRVAADTHECEAGSTASVAIVTPEGHLTVGHVGDSPVMLFIRNRRTGEFKGVDLITAHNLYNAEERARLRTDQPPGPTITRNLGAKDWGLSHEADIKTYDLSAALDSPDEEFFLVAGSDGVHHDSIDTSELQASYNLRGASGAEDICARLMTDYGPGSDNASAVIARIPSKIQTGLVMGVFDGHNGAADVAEYARQSCAVAFPQPLSGPRAAIADAARRTVPLWHMIGDNYRYVRTDRHTGVGKFGDEIVSFTGNQQFLGWLQATLAQNGIESVIETGEGSSRFPAGLRVRSGSMAPFNEFMMGNPVVQAGTSPAQAPSQPAERIARGVVLDNAGFRPKY